MHLLFAAFMFCACGAQSELRTRTALDVLGQVVDPAFQAAMAGCVAQEAVVMERARRGEITSVDARAKLDEIMGPCLKVGAAFERVRKLHEKAVILLESGQLKQAEALLGELRKAWALLGEVPP